MTIIWVVAWRHNLWSETRFPGREVSCRDQTVAGARRCKEIGVVLYLAYGISSRCCIGCKCSLGFLFLFAWVVYSIASVVKFNRALEGKWRTKTLWLGRQALPPPGDQDSILLQVRFAFTFSTTIIFLERSRGRKHKDHAFLLLFKNSFHSP